jgi:excinuclease UvrABC nuclease subunit
LLKKFGSVRGIISAPKADLIDLVGPKKAQTISEYLSE